MTANRVCECGFEAKSPAGLSAHKRIKHPDGGGVLEEVGLAPQASEEATESKSHTIHFVDDGFFFLHKVWVRGEEFTAVEGDENWDKVKNLIEMTSEQQRRRWGKVFFYPGPWPYERIDWNEDTYLEHLPDDEVEAILKLEKTMAARKAKSGKVRSE